MENNALDFFKERIGQAILETTLLQYGYKVERLGCQIPPVMINAEPVEKPYEPDLLVTMPDNHKIYLETKLRPSYPFRVYIERDRVEFLRQYYPDTYLVFISALNGSVNFLGIDDASIHDAPTDDRGFYQLELLEGAWKPVWEIFPQVKKDDKTGLLWNEMKETLRDFAANRLTSTSNSGYFAEERENLKDYIERNWHPGMMVQNIRQINPDYTDIADIWNHAMEIHAFRFAFDLCGGEANMDHPAFSQVMDKLRGRADERLKTIPYRKIKETLTEYPDLYAKLQKLEEKVSQTLPYDAAVVLMEGLLEILPPGIGQVYVLPEKGAGSDTIEVDFRTLLILLQGRNCL